MTSEASVFNAYISTAKIKEMYSTASKINIEGSFQNLTGFQSITITGPGEYKFGIYNDKNELLQNLKITIGTKSILNVNGFAGVLDWSDIDSPCNVDSVNCLIPENANKFIDLDEEYGEIMAFKGGGVADLWDDKDGYYVEVNLEGETLTGWIVGDIEVDLDNRDFYIKEIDGALTIHINTRKLEEKYEWARYIQLGNKEWADDITNEKEIYTEISEYGLLDFELKEYTSPPSNVPTPKEAVGYIRIRDVELVNNPINGTCYLENIETKEKIDITDVSVIDTENNPFYKLIVFSRDINLIMLFQHLQHLMVASMLVGYFILVVTSKLNFKAIENYYLNSSLLLFHKKFTKKLAIGVDNC